VLRLRAPFQGLPNVPPARRAFHRRMLPPGRVVDHASTHSPIATLISAPDIDVRAPANRRVKISGIFCWIEGKVLGYFSSKGCHEIFCQALLYR